MPHVAFSVAQSIIILVSKFIILLLLGFLFENSTIMTVFLQDNIKNIRKINFLTAMLRCIITDKCVIVWIIIYALILSSVPHPLKVCLTVWSPLRGSGCSILHFKSLSSLQTSFHVSKKDFLKAAYASLSFRDRDSGGRLWAPVWGEGSGAVWRDLYIINTSLHRWC